MTKIIAHRGASGSALENSIAAMKHALAQDVDGIEFDVHLTRDGKIVVIHDAHTARVASKVVYVRTQTLAELQALSLKDGQKIPTLDQVLDVAGTKPVSIDIKDDGTCDELLRVLARHPKARVTVVSFRHGELAAIRKARPEIPTYVLEHFAPFAIVRSARHLHTTGIGLNMWLMNPFTYLTARRSHLRLYVYTVNRLWLARFLLKLYPGVDICTDFPARMRPVRKLAKETAAQEA